MRAIATILAGDRSAPCGWIRSRPGSGAKAVGRRVDLHAGPSESSPDGGAGGAAEGCQRERLGRDQHQVGPVRPPAAPARPSRGPARRPGGGTQAPPARRTRRCRPLLARRPGPRPRRRGRRPRRGRSEHGRGPRPGGLPRRAAGRRIGARGPWPSRCSGRLRRSTRSRPDPIRSDVPGEISELIVRVHPTPVASLRRWAGRIGLRSARAASPPRGRRPGCAAAAGPRWRPRRRRRSRPGSRPYRDATGRGRDSHLREQRRRVRRTTDSDRHGTPMPGGGRSVA